MLLNIGRTNAFSCFSCPKNIYLTCTLKRDFVIVLRLLSCLLVRIIAAHLLLRLLLMLLNRLLPTLHCSVLILLRLPVLLGRLLHLLLAAAILAAV